MFLYCKILKAEFSVQCDIEYSVGLLGYYLASPCTFLQRRGYIACPCKVSLFSIRWTKVLNINFVKFAISSFVFCRKFIVRELLKFYGHKCC